MKKASLSGVSSATAETTRKIGVAGIQILAAEQFLVECQAVGIVDVAAAEKCEKPGFLGLDDVSQLPVAEP